MHMRIQRRPKPVQKYHPAAPGCGRRACARSRCGALHFLHHDACYPIQAACIDVQKVAYSLRKYHHPLPEAHSPPCAQPSPPLAVCCISHTPRAPCTNTLPISPDHTSHSLPAQTRTPEFLTPKTSAGRVRRIPIQDTHSNLSGDPAHPRTAALARSPNSAAHRGTPQSALAAGVYTPQRTSLRNYGRQLPPACQRRPS